LVKKAVRFGWKKRDGGRIHVKEGVPIKEGGGKQEKKKKGQKGAFRPNPRGANGETEIHTINEGGRGGTENEKGR